MQGLTQALERLVTSVSVTELRLAGNLAPGIGERLERLCEASQHLQAAQAALAGVSGKSEDSTDGPLQGSSKAVPIQDLLCFLATTQKSGVLRVQAQRECFLLQLDKGSVVYATGDSPPIGEGLRELLAQRGVVSTELLDLLPEHLEEGLWFDRNLVGTTWISREPLESAIQQQTRLSFFRLCSAPRTRFRFYEGAEIQNVVPIRQNAMELLLEYSRHLDETSSKQNGAESGLGTSAGVAVQASFTAEARFTPEAGFAPGEPAPGYVRWR